MNLLVSVLIYVLVAGLIAALIQYAPIDGRIKQIGLYVVLVVFVIALIMMLAGGVGPVVVVR